MAPTMTTQPEIAVGDVVRIRPSACKVFGGCHALVKQVVGRSVGVEILAPSMAEGNGPWMFEAHEISASRDDWP